jgi:transposase
VDQQTLTGLHRLRSAWMADRTGRINLVRGLLRELGFALPVGARHVLPRAGAVLDSPDSEIPMPLRLTLGAALQEIRDLETRIAEVEKQLRALAAQMPVVKRLLSIPGIGLLTATALVAFVGDVQRFASCRRFASFLGLTPREHSSGARRWLGRISKRGDIYLRMLLIHGARSVLLAAKRYPQPDRLRAWALHLQATRGHNKAAVALANKLARIVWAVWRHDSFYQSQPAV